MFECDDSCMSAKSLCTYFLVYGCARVCVYCLCVLVREQCEIRKGRLEVWQQNPYMISSVYLVADVDYPFGLIWDCAKHGSMVIPSVKT